MAVILPSAMYLDNSAFT